MSKDAAYGAKVLDRIKRDLEKPDELRSEYIRILVEKAQENASSRPTPQSGIAADGIIVSGSVIRTSAGIPSAVAASSEFGSDIYPQFQHTHTAEGLWLHPAAEDVDVLRHTDQELEQLLEDAK